MSESAARVAVIVAVTLTVVFETAAVALTFGAGSLGQALIYAVYAVVQILAGAAVVWSHPHHRVGWLLVVTSFFNATFTTRSSHTASRRPCTAGQPPHRPRSSHSPAGWSPHSGWSCCSCGSPTGKSADRAAGSRGCGPWVRSWVYPAGR